MKHHKYWLGKHHSEETKKKMSKSQIGKHNYWKGKKFSKEHKAKIGKASALLVGEKHWNWQGGITPINLKIKRSLEYKLWRQAVFERDKFTCIWCGQIRGDIEVDHIKPFALYPELRFAIDNGRTLCHNCHLTTDTYGGNIRRFQK